jgi:hypothetical protein
VLRKHYVTCLHTTYAVSRQGIYKDWTEAQRDNFLGDCVDVAAKHCARGAMDGVAGKFGLYTFVVSIVLKGFIEHAKLDTTASRNANEACLRQALAEVLI